MAFSPTVAKLSGHSLFRRCVDCPTTLPTCPPCNSEESCTVTTRSCDQCPTISCQKNSELNNAGTATTSSQPTNNVAAIAGGVTSGVAVISLITFLVWWFVVRKKRKAYAQSVVNGSDEKAARDTSRLSRRSMASIASTVLTRASNVIQIAYLPGITNQSHQTSPSLIPPVPPLPSAQPSAMSTPAYPDDQHFFLPLDLRDSTYSDVTTPRHSVAPSLTRSSVATTIYRNNAIVNPVPAQQAMRGRAAVVSVHLSAPPSNEASPSRTEAPAVPAITAAQLNKAGVLNTPNSSIVARSVMPRWVNVTRSASTSTKTKNPDLSEEDGGELASRTVPRFDPQSSTFEDSSDDEGERKEGALGPLRKGTTRTSYAARIRSERQSAVPTLIEDSPAANQGPFADTHATSIGLVRPLTTARLNTRSNPSPVHGQGSSQNLNRLRAEAFSNISSSQAGVDNSKSQETVTRAESPFSDIHEVKP